MKLNKIIFGRAFTIIVLSFFIFTAILSCTSKTISPATTTKPTSPVNTTIPAIMTTKLPPVSSPTSIPSTTPGLTQTPTSTPVTVTSSSPVTIFSVSAGSISILKPGAAAWISATAGMILQPGDTIKSGSNSQAEITFFDGSVLEIFPDTEIKISDLNVSVAGSTTIRMQQQIGKTISRVKKLTDSASRYEIETPAAVAAVRGSIMTVTVYRDGTTVVTNESGDIRAIAQEIEVIIPVGMKVTIRPGEAPGKPEPINPPGGGGSGTLTPTPSTTSPTTTPPTTTPPTTTPPTTTPPGGGGGGGTPITTPPPTPVYIASISTATEADRSEARIGEVITYTYRISNTGNIRLQDVSVSDNVVGTPVYQSGDTDTDSFLDPGETWIYRATHIVSINDPSPLVSTARFSAATGSSTILVAEDPVEVSILPSNLTIEITSPSDGAIADTSPVGISGTVSDTALSSGTITVNGNSQSMPIFAGSFNINVNIASGQNVISVNVTNLGGATANDSITIIRSAPAIAIVNTSSVTQATVGDVIAYTYTITNPGNVPLSGITVSDSVTGDITYQNGDTNGNGILDVGEQWRYTTQHTAVTADIVTLVNTATATGIYSGTAQTLTVSALSSVTVIGTYQVKIQLTWDTAGTNVDGHLIRPGGTIFSGVDDCYYGNPHPDWGTQGVIQGDPYLDHDDTDGYGPETIYLSQPFESGDYKYAVHYRADNGQGATKATVTVWYNGVQVESWQKSLVNGEIWYCINFDWSLYYFLADTPFILLEKFASVASARPGNTITYTYYVGNFGNVSLSNVTVTDDKITTPIVYQSGDTNQNGRIDVNEIWVFSATYSVTGGEGSPLINSATATGIVPATGVKVTTWATTSVIIIP
jgi:uncharacterized repeat protein (TIGR01451 family)